MNPGKLIVPVKAQDHILGPPHALVTLVEYGDFECSYCGKANSIIHRLEDEFQEDLQFVFRHFPLRQAHPHSQEAAEAAEAAGAQDRFWEMHDLLYENQDALTPDDISQYAQTLGLNMDQFEYDIRERRFSPRVSDDFRSGIRSGVTGTPSFFLNGFRYDGSWEFEALSSAIRRVMDEETIRRAI
jgi:protein-disulfide isomerase